MKEEFARRFNKDHMKLKAELSLYEYTKQAWHILHPSTPFVEGWAVGAIAEHLQGVTEGDIQRLLINVPPGSTKALREDEPILTPFEGWKPHGDLRPGDFVYGPDGRPKKVERVTPKFRTPEWRVTFNDGTSIITSEAHEWTVQRDLNETPRCRRPLVVETRDILVKSGDQRPDSILVGEPIQMPQQRGQLIDPYLLGAWLGDGNAWDGMITCHKDDAYVLREHYGAVVSRSDGDENQYLRLRIPSLKVKLRIMGLERNKHIPEAYLLGSVDQRMELLRGYLDTDGCATQSGSITFSQSTEHLAYQVAFLIRSLGYRTKVIKHKSRLYDKTFDSWRMQFCPLPGEKLFKLKRKQDRISSQRAKVNVRTRHRYVKSIERLDTEAIMSCIQVNGNKYIAGPELIALRNSMLTNVFWPSWEWGPWGTPDMQYINASYDQALAIRDMLYCRDLVSSEWYQERWPIQWKDDDRGKTKFSNTQRGFRYATGVGGNVMGWRGQRFIIDDPHNTKTAESDIERGSACSWFTEATPTRFTDPKRPVYVIIMQRLHVDDISGVVVNKLIEEQGWTHLCLPMEFEPKYRCYTSLKPIHHKAKAVRMRRVRDEGDPLAHWVPDAGGALVYSQDPRTEEDELMWPERHDAKSVRDLKVQLMVDGGDYGVASQLQQRPVPRKGGMFKRDMIGFCESPAEGIAIRGWDLAATKDRDGRGKKTQAAYTVGVKMTLGYDGTLTVDDVVRMRGDADEVRRLIRSTAEADGYKVAQSVPQDPGQAGKSQVLDYSKILHGFDVRFSLESGDKETRAEPFSAQCNAGNVKLVRAPWCDAFLAEIGLFPGSRWKDQVDAASRAYHEHLKDVSDPVSLFGVRLLFPDD